MNKEVSYVTAFLQLLLSRATYSLEQTVPQPTTCRRLPLMIKRELVIKLNDYHVGVVFAADEDVTSGV